MIGNVFSFSVHCVLTFSNEIVLFPTCFHFIGDAHSQVVRATSNCVGVFCHTQKFSANKFAVVYKVCRQSPWILIWNRTKQNESNIRVYSSIEFQCGTKFYRAGLYSCKFEYTQNAKRTMHTSISCMDMDI